MRKLPSILIVLAIALGAVTAASAQMDAMDALNAPPPAPPAKLPPSVLYAQDVIAFTHAEIVDGTGTAPRRDMTLVSDHGKIAALGPSARTSIPAGATIIDMHGKTLLPGFVMVHEHLFYPLGQGNYDGLLNSFPALYLAGGTTTARTAGTVSPDGDLNLRDAIARGEAIGPDLDVTAPYLNGPGQPIYKMHILKDPADATRTVNYWAEEGATSFKAYMTLTRDELAAAVVAAHAHNLKITGHLCSVTYREAAERGIDNLEHGFAAMTDFVKGKQPDVCPPQSILSLVDLDVNGSEIKSLIALLIAHHVALTSTLTVFETFTPGRPEAPEAARAMLIPELRSAYETSWTAVQTQDRSKPYGTIFPKLMKLEKMFVDAGGTLLAGTDPTGYGGVIPGWSGKREIELLVEAGFTFPAALKIATLSGAQYLGRDAHVGSLAIGKRADIAVIDGDPAHDPMALEHMPLVFKAGIGYRADLIMDSFRGKVGLY
ncbi:MAG TPA: amidohydrolase family protein [Rhizomicrobium sp.]|nr:amidohydrolase family protein [Rhizomicrobium sp.]